MGTPRDEGGSTTTRGPTVRRTSREAALPSPDSSPRTRCSNRTRATPAEAGGPTIWLPGFMGALSGLAGPLPAAFVVAGVTVLVTVATAATGQAWRRRPRNA